MKIQDSLEGMKDPGNVRSVRTWWCAWRNWSEAAWVCRLFKVSRRQMRQWLRGGLAGHEIVKGLPTCEAVWDGFLRRRLNIHPLGFAHWHAGRMAAGKDDAPEAVRQVENFWPEAWAALRIVSAETCPLECPAFSWERVAGNLVLFSVCMALVWRNCGLTSGGPFLIGAEMPADFAIRLLAAPAKKGAAQ